MVPFLSLYLTINAIMVIVLVLVVVLVKFNLYTRARVKMFVGL